MTWIGLTDAEAEELLALGCDLRACEPPALVPCSPRHRSCSHAHAALVEAYHAAKEQNRRLVEDRSCGYRGDVVLLAARGECRVLTFREFIVHR